MEIGRRMTLNDISGKSREELLEMFNILQSTVILQQIEIANLTEARRLASHKKFVATSDQMNYLFDEAELIDCLSQLEEQSAGTEEKKDGENEENGKAEPAGKSKVKDGGKTPKRVRTNTSELSANASVVDVDHTEGAPDEIVRDGVRMTRDGDSILKKVSYIPPQYIVELHIYPKYKAVETLSDDRKENVAVLYENPVVDRLAVSPAFMAYMLVSKYDDYQPYYRQEEILARYGLHVSRQKMAGWVIKYYDVLMPLAKLMRRRVFTSKAVYHDETNTLVLDVKGENGKPSNNSYVYISIGADWDPDRRTRHAIVLCEYHQGRKTAEIIENFKMHKFNGYLMSDGLDQYGHYEHPEKHAICWVHAVRGFKDALKVNPDNRAAKQICLLAAKLYKIEDAQRHLLEAGEIDGQQFLAKRRELAEPIIDSIFKIVDDCRPAYTPGGLMGKAIAYIDAYRSKLKTYLDCIELEPSNNVCERSAKAFATGRKNWLFSKCVDGADAACFFFSLIETAKRCGLNPQDYLEYVCTFGPAMKTDEEFETILPWNVDLSRLDAIRAHRLTAAPDPDRTDPYIFAGAVI